MSRATRLVALALVSGCLSSLGTPPARAVDKCSVKADKTGALLVHASGVEGPLLWGAQPGQEVHAFFDASCVSGGRAKACALGAPGSEAARTPPPGCTLYLDDGVLPCEARVKACTPGVRAADLAADRAAGLYGAAASVEVGGASSQTAATEFDSIEVVVPGNGTLTVLLFANVFVNCDSSVASAHICSGAGLAICTTPAAFDSCGTSFLGIDHADADDSDDQNDLHPVTLGRTLPVTAGTVQLFINGRSYADGAITLIQSGQVVAIFQPGGELTISNP